MIGNTIGTAQVIRGNALQLPLSDNTVDLVVTSPPYFGLRSYQDGGEHYAGQIGSEATPAEFVDALIAATREMVRVLKPSGSIFVNLGDKYSSTSAGSNWRTAKLDGGRGRLPELHESQASAPRLKPGVPTKSLIGIPWRYALRCIDDLGLILRAEIIWSKPNGLPESVTDRVRRSHEQWFHFTLSPRYYSAVDEIREEHLRTWGPGNNGGHSHRLAQSGVNSESNLDRSMPNPLGKLPGSVWTIPTQPLQVPEHLGIDHFAAFPMEWPRRIIKGWSPSGVCTDCGEGRRPVVHRATLGRDNSYATDRGRSTARPKEWLALKAAQPDTITGYACGCPEPTAATTPGVILDPFGGTGTTALLAKALGRTGISVDMSADYCRLAEWRTTDPDQLAAALQVEKPEPVHPDQLDLLADQESA